MAHQVPNVYKATLRERRPQAVSVAEDLRSALDGAAKAMAAGAWQSDAATAFEHALVAQRRTLRSAAGAVTTEFDAEIAHQPDLVDEHSFEATFGRYQRLLAHDR